MAWMTGTRTPYAAPTLQQIDPWAPDTGGYQPPADDGTLPGVPGEDAPQLPPTGMEYLGGSQNFDESTGTYRDPNQVDTRGDSSLPYPEYGVVTHGWTDPAGGGGTAAPATSAPGTGVNAPVNGGPSIQQAYSSALQKILTGGNVQNPANSDAMVAYRNEAARGEARDRAFLAERASATGTSASGAFESDLLGLRQNRRRGEASFRGLEQQRLQEAERQQLMQALALALSQGDNEAARAIQLELGRGQLDVSRYGIGASRDTAMDQLGLGYARLQSDKDADALRYIFGN